MGKQKNLSKDPNFPKKPTRPYIHFLMEVRKEVSEEMSKNCGEVNTHHEVSRECARRWAALSADQKEKFHEKFREDLKRYREAMKSYTPSQAFEEKVRFAKFQNSSSQKSSETNPKHDPNIVKVPHMIRAYFDYMASTWSSIAASHPSFNPGQVQDEIWRRWSQGDIGGGSGSSIFDENQNIEKKQLKKRIRKQTALKNHFPRQPRQAFDCYVETLTDEVRKYRPDLSDSDMHKLVSGKWTEMTDVQKAPFFDVERKEKQKYEFKMKKFLWKDITGVQKVPKYEVQMKKFQEKEKTTNKEVGIPLSGNVQNEVIRPDVEHVDDKVGVTREQHNVSDSKEQSSEFDASLMSFDFGDSLAKIRSKKEQKEDVSANDYVNKEKSVTQNLVDYSSSSSYEEEVEGIEADATLLSSSSRSSDDDYSSDDNDDSDSMFAISTPADQIKLAGKPLPQ